MSKTHRLLLATAHQESHDREEWVSTTNQGRQKRCYRNQCQDEFIYFFNNAETPPVEYESNVYKQTRDVNNDCEDTALSKQPQFQAGDFSKCWREKTAKAADPAVYGKMTLRPCPQSYLSLALMSRPFLHSLSNHSVPRSSTSSSHLRTDDIIISIS